MTTADYNAYLARNLRTKTGEQTGPGVLRELDLHQQIMDECDRRGWLYFHGAMCRRTSRTLGEPDLIVMTDLCTYCGKSISQPGNCPIHRSETMLSTRVLLIECKTRTGKLSPEQQAVAAHARKLGHTVHVVRCAEDFINVVNNREVI